MHVVIKNHVFLIRSFYHFLYLITLQLCINQKFISIVIFVGLILRVTQFSFHTRIGVLSKFLYSVPRNGGSNLIIRIPVDDQKTLHELVAYLAN